MITPLENLSGSGTPTPVTPTVEDIIKYGFKVTDLAGVDRTEAVTSLKMSTDDGPVATAEVSNGKITIEADKLSGIASAIDFWFEAEIGGKNYVAKVNIDPATLSPTTDKTLAMATVGDVILSDGTFDKPTTTKTKVALITYVGNATDASSPYTHGLALALEDVSDTHLSWDNSLNDNNGKTAAEWCSEWNTSKAVTGASWMLPSAAQWEAMGATSSTSLALRDGFTSVGGTNVRACLAF